MNEQPKSTQAPKTVVEKYERIQTLKAKVAEKEAKLLAEVKQVQDKVTPPVEAVPQVAPAPEAPQVEQVEVPQSTFVAHQEAKQQEATRISPAQRRSQEVKSSFLSGITGQKFMAGTNPKFRK